MTLTELKEKYGEMTPVQLDKKALTLKDNLDSSDKELTEILFWMDHTKRFRELKMFRDSDFGHYLRARFNMTEAQFKLKRFAYIKHQDEVEKYGVGTVTEIVRKVGEKQLTKVVQSMEKRLNAKKPEPLYQAMKKAISEVEPKKKPVAKKIIESMNVKEFSDLRKENEELRDRNAKLVQTVMRQKQEIKELETLKAEYESKIREYEALLDNITKPLSGRIPMPEIVNVPL